MAATSLSFDSVGAVEVSSAEEKLPDYREALTNLLLLLGRVLVAREGLRDELLLLPLNVEHTILNGVLGNELEDANAVEWRELLAITPRWRVTRLLTSGFVRYGTRGRWLAPR